MCVVRRAANSLVQQRILLSEDADPLVDEAGSGNVLPSDDASSSEARAIADPDKLGSFEVEISFYGISLDAQ
jgi:hypothetical protein